MVLPIAAALHIVAAVQLTQARPGQPPGRLQQQTLGQRRRGRPLHAGQRCAAGVFIVVHILQLTTGTLLPGFRAGDVYANVLIAFSNPLVVLFYILAMVALGFHLYHGIWSTLQTLGWNIARSDRGSPERGDIRHRRGRQTSAISSPFRWRSYRALR